MDKAFREEEGGFRLDRVELYNWGTFDGTVSVIRPECKNMLLTGDIGSGKSTIVDAIATLLASPGKAAYNKAAGAGAGERSLLSYVRGQYKSNENEFTGTLEPQYLRQSDAYTVILGAFRDARAKKTLTTALFCSMEDGTDQPVRIYFGFEGDLSIAKNFSGFGDIPRLKQRMKAAGVRVFETFKAYITWFCNKVGIENDQALNLFLQTISMKSVDSLEAFVRKYMLEPFPAREQIDKLLKHFDDLTKIHEEILKAKRRIAILDPMMRKHETYADVVSLETREKNILASLEHWFAAAEKGLFEEKKAQLEERLAAVQVRIATGKADKTALEDKRQTLKMDIERSGGSRIAEIEQEIHREEVLLGHVRRRASTYVDRLHETGLCLDVSDEMLTEAIFLETKRKIAEFAAEMAARKDAAEERRDSVREPLRKLEEDLRGIREELRSLRSRKNNLPDAKIRIRAFMCQNLGLSESEIPFAGELLRVRDDCKEWEGAAERLMNGFATSLLVPEKRYMDVASWVNRTHLGGRLDYLRVSDNAGTAPTWLREGRICSKVEIRPDSPFSEWLERSVAGRFDHVCCEDAKQLSNENKGITKTGQIRQSYERHLKDDRYDIDDRSRYVLGWNNREKIEILESKERELIAVIDAKTLELKKEQAALREIDDFLGKANALGDTSYAFDEMNFLKIVNGIERLRCEKDALESSSDVLRTLRAQLQQTEDDIANAESALDRLFRTMGEIEHERKDIVSRLADAESVLSGSDEPDPETSAGIGEMVRAVLDTEPLTIDNCVRTGRTAGSRVKESLGRTSERKERLAGDISRIMRSYQDEFRNDVLDADATVEFFDIYAGLYDKVRFHDLPSCEQEFKKALNEDTMLTISLFQATLNNAGNTIKQKISTINETLQHIDYTPGRYIRLDAKETPDAEIRAFRQDLRKCTSDITDEYDISAKFDQVKEILARFKGREGCTDMDRKWTDKVTDVRNWFVFTASECNREDGVVYESYSDSSGKSGGQKEKLAYTVLAAGIAYQFGLNIAGNAEGRMSFDAPRSFCFVIIDEAFSRGSAESAEYGLELFKRIGIQLLVVTPLLKINVIDPFVSSVAFVRCDETPEGKNSLVRMITMDEYRAKKESVAA